MKVTAKNLRRMRACKEQVAIFEKEWPNGVEVTAESLRRACRLGLDLNWWAQMALSGQKLGEYAQRSWPLDRRAIEEDWCEWEDYPARLRRRYRDILIEVLCAVR